jgi:hypothetical protein
MAIFSLVVSPWIFSHFLDGGVEQREGILQDGLHESPGLDVDHAHFTLRRLQHDGAGARRACGIIEGTEQAWFCGDEIDNLFAVPNMVTAGNHGHTGTQKVDCDLRGNSPARCSVFAIDDNEIELPIPLPFWKASDDRAPARFADDVAEEKKREHSRMIVLNSKIPS